MNKQPTDSINNWYINMLTIKLSNTTIAITFDVSPPSSVREFIITTDNIAGRPAERATPQKMRKLQMMLEMFRRASS